MCAAQGEKLYNGIIKRDAGNPFPREWGYIMKLVINTPFGGFSLPKAFCEKYGFESEYDDIERTDSRLIEYVEKNPYGDLKVIEVPNEATDYIITEYDGSERVLYVLGGKIHWAVAKRG